MDDETKRLWKQEIKWRDQEVKRLKDQLFETRKKIVDASTPTDHTGTFFIGAMVMLIMWLPAWGYGRNSWQQILYWINNLIWSNKEWWY